MRGRIAVANAALAVVLGGCAAVEGDTVSFTPGDGVLDCDDGQVVRAVGITASAGTELEVVESALERWIREDAEVVQLPADESWVAVLDGRDVAIVYPEVDGTGAWVTHDVQTCDEPAEGSGAIDGELDCVNDYRWTMQGSIDPSVPGFPTEEEALTMALEPFVFAHDGEIVFVDETVGSLVVDQREQVVARAGEVPAGGWTVLVVEACEGFEL